MVPSEPRGPLIFLEGVAKKFPMVAIFLVCEEDFFFGRKLAPEPPTLEQLAIVGSIVFYLNAHSN